MNLIRMSTVLCAVALPVAVYSFAGCSSASTSGGFAEDGGSTNHGGDGSSSSGSSSGNGGSNSGGGSGSTSGGGSGSGSGGGSGSGSGGGSGSGSGGGSGSGSGSSSGAAADCTNAPGDAGASQDCINCCQSSPPVDSDGTNTGFDTFLNALLTCACANPCKSLCSASAACSTSSTAPQPSDACVTCINDSLNAADGGEGACYQSVDSACTADPNCLAYNTCANSCPQ